MASTLDLTPHVVVTVHTPAGDVPIVADLNSLQGGSGSGGTVTLLGYSMPYDVALTFGVPDTSAPGTLWGNLQDWQAQLGPMAALGLLAVGAFLMSRKRRR